MTARQPRGEERRKQVIEATLRLLAREGPRSVTHRAVAAEAGTSLRSTTYYFESRQALLREALLHYQSTAMDRFAKIASRGLTERGDAIDSAADLLALTVLSDLEEDRAGLVAELELALEVGRDPTLEATYAAWERGLLDLLEAFATELGARDPKRAARVVLATLRGLEIEALVHPSRKASRAELRETFSMLLRAIGADAGATKTVSKVRAPLKRP
ncbi:MAG: TetR/AcrR family transcriptional regulator [Polyangiales bacterium]